MQRKFKYLILATSFLLCAYSSYNCGRFMEKSEITENVSRYTLSRWRDHAQMYKGRDEFANLYLEKCLNAMPPIPYTDTVKTNSDAKRACVNNLLKDKLLPYTEIEINELMESDEALIRTLIDGHIR